MIIHNNDTIVINLPATLKTYEGNNYSLDVYGYRCELKRIDILQKETIITVEKTKYLNQLPKMQFGIAGGFHIDNKNVYEYVGAKAHLNITNNFYIEGFGGYSPSLKSPIIKGEVGINFNI